MCRHRVFLLVTIHLASASIVAAQEATRASVAAGSRPGLTISAGDHGVSVAAADNTAAVQAAINACQKAGGGIVEFPTGTFRLTGTLTMSSNHVWLRGVGRGAATLVLRQRRSGLHRRRQPHSAQAARRRRAASARNKITDLNIVHGTKTAGRTVAVINHADFILEKVTIDHCVVGVYAERINNVVLRDVIIIPDNKGALIRRDCRGVPGSACGGTPRPIPTTVRRGATCLYFDNVVHQLQLRPPARACSGTG